MTIPVVELKCKEAFNQLSDKEKKYCYYLSNASWEGSLICLFQCSIESPYLFLLFQKLFSIVPPEKLYLDDFNRNDIDNFLEYVAEFYSNMGNYNSFGDDKFCPKVDKEVFKNIVKKYLNPSNKYDKILLDMLDEFTEVIYSNPKTKLGFPPNEISTYYSKNVTEDEIKLVQEFMELQGWSPYNTRIFKKDNILIIKIACSHYNPELKYNSDLVGIENLNLIFPTTYFYKTKQIEIKYEDFDFSMHKVCNNLRSAQIYCANTNQLNMLESYITSFEYGSIPHHIHGSYVWTKDINPNVESYIGFIESYRDPQGVRGEFEGFVAVVNKETSKKFTNLVNDAQKFIELLPWGKQYEKDTFLKPDFTSLEVITFASSGIPSGINIPNYDSVRQNHGFKNVALSNVISSKENNNKISNIPNNKQELYKKYNIPAFEIQVGLHELLGHGSGKLFNESYNNGKTYDTVFTDLASAMEECRAECVGLYLCFEKEILNIFGHDNDDVAYVNWMSELRAGIMGLKYYHPETDKWGQAHMQARYAILQICLEAGNGLIEIIENPDYVENDLNNKNVDIIDQEDLICISVNKEKIMTDGIPAIGKFLKQLQIYKSTANANEGREFFKKYTKVDDYMMSLREKIIKTSKPRGLMVQCNLKMSVDGEVKINSYEPTYNGLIKSFKERFNPENKEMLKFLIDEKADQL
jgi:dipeptidyl-peptidase-3